MGTRRGDASAAPTLHVALEPKPSIEGPDDGLDVATRLAAELGHDLNNELTAALNYSFLLAHGVDDPELKEHLDELQAAVWRASHLSQALRLFAPRQRDAHGTVDVNEALGGLSPLLGRLLGGVRMETHFDPRLAAARGARAALEQAVLGLAAHARSTVMPGGTVVFATSSHASHGRAYVRVSCVRRAPNGRSPSGEVHVLPGRTMLPWSPYRRALRALGARMSHDATAVHIDLAVA